MLNRRSFIAAAAALFSPLSSVFGSKGEPLEAVGQDFDGEIKPIGELSYVHSEDAKHPDRIVIDDPQNAGSTESERVREWWDMKLKYRGMNARGKVVIVLSRIEGTE